MSFIGKFAAVGQGGSGKSRAIAEIANYLSNQQLYPWKEEVNLSGTLSVTPYSINIPNAISRLGEEPNTPKKIIIADNPGQNSLELVRQSVAKSGANYKGILIFSDALGWNFHKVGILHAESIAQYSKTKELPVAFVTSKTDMILLFQQTDILYSIIDCLSNTIKEIYNGMIVPYLDRVKNKQNSFAFYLIEGGWFPFTHLEQVLVNALDKEFENRINGFTFMNRRLFVRSLLLGYCDYYLKEYPEYIRKYPVFNAIDENLVNALNYHRPTAWETGTPWRVLSSKSRSGYKIAKNEPPFRVDAFDSTSISFVLNQFCLGTQSRHYELENQIRERASDRGWKFVASVYTDSVSRHGIEKTVDVIRQLVQEADKPSKKRFFGSDIDRIGLGAFQ